MTDRPPTPEELQQFQKWHDAGAPSGKKPATGGPDLGGAPEEEHGTLYNVGRGLMRGVGSDIPGVESENRPEAGLAETGAYYTGKIAPFFTPMGEEALVAKGLEWAVNPANISRLVKAVGPQNARSAVKWVVDHAGSITGAGSTVLKGARGGAMADPEHPLEGAATGAATAGTLGAAGSVIPTPVKKGAMYGAGLAGALGAGAALGGRHAGFPMIYGLHHLAIPLAALAAAVMGKPAITGGVGSAARQWLGDDDGGQQ
jgi:hypothetical protein